MGQKKEHSNLIKEHLKKRDITQTWLAKELGMILASQMPMSAIASNPTSPPSSKWQTCLKFHPKN